MEGIKLPASSFSSSKSMKIDTDTQSICNFHQLVGLRIADVILILFDCSEIDANFENFVQIYYEDMEHRLREKTMRTKKFIIDLKIIPYFKKKNMNEIKASYERDLVSVIENQEKNEKLEWIEKEDCR